MGRDFPDFEPITPERIDAIYRELMKAYPNGENNATMWSLRRQSFEMLEREQERIVRLYESLAKRGDEHPASGSDAGSARAGGQ